MATEPRGVTLESPTVWVKMLSPSMAYSVVPLMSPRVIACLSERADVVHGTVDVDAMKLVPVEWVTREFRDVKVDAGGVQSDEAVGREAQRVDEEGGAARRAGRKEIGQGILRHAVEARAGGGPAVGRDRKPCSGIPVRVASSVPAPSPC